MFLSSFLLLLRYGEYGSYAERQFAESFCEDACWNQMGGLGGCVVYAMAEDHAIIQRGATPVAVCVGLPIRARLAAPSANRGCRF